MTVPQKIASKGEIMESVLLKGDLGKLTPEERSTYYLKLCESIGLNPLTKPMEYIVLNGKLTLYAKRDAADQLRKLNGISIKILSQDYDTDNGLLSVHVQAHDKEDRVDEDLGVVALPNTLKGDARANAILKAVTKAKRRVTLSISGLGFLDETEVQDIPEVAKRPRAPAPNVMLPAHDRETGEIQESPPEVDAADQPPPADFPSSSVAPAVAGGGEVSMTELDAGLEEAAKLGTIKLRDAWEKIEPKHQKFLKAALERRHKPVALQVDAASAAD